MRWRSFSLKNGDLIKREIFAWKPTRLLDGSKVWLEKFYEVQVYQNIPDQIRHILGAPSNGRLTLERHAYNSPEHIKWHNDTRTNLAEIFGWNSNPDSKPQKSAKILAMIPKKSK